MSCSVYTNALALIQNLKAQLTVEFENLKVALANKTVNIEKESNAKLEALKERLAEWTSVVRRELVGK